MHFRENGGVTTKGLGVDVDVRGTYPALAFCGEDMENLNEISILWRFNPVGAELAHSIQGICGCENHASKGTEYFDVYDGRDRWSGLPLKMHNGGPHYGPNCGPNDGSHSSRQQHVPLVAGSLPVFFGLDLLFQLTHR
jgi:hypothetical protein